MLKPAVKISQESLFIYLAFIPLLLGYHAVAFLKLPTALNSIFYFLPVYGLMIMFVLNIFDYERKLKIDFSFIQIAFAYLILVCVSLFFNQREIYQDTFWRDTIIAVLPLFLFAFQWKFSETQFNWLFLGAILSYLTWIGFDLELNFVNTLFISSYNDLEYHFGCVAGLFVVYYLYKNKWLWLAIAVFFLFLVNKRANLLGLFAAVPVYYLIVSPLKLYDKKVWLFLFLLIYYMFFWMIGTNMEYFCTMFLKAMGVEFIDLDYFLTGRMILIYQLQPEILDRGLLPFLFGNGPGQADVFIWKTLSHPTIYHFETKPFLVHNDFLKLQFDIGLIGAVLYFFIFYYLYVCSRVGVFIFLYAIPLFLIDNTIIYLYNILVGCVIARVIDKPELNELNIFGPLFRFFGRRV